MVEATRREYSALFETKKNQEHIWPENAGVTLYKKSNPSLPPAWAFTFGTGAQAVELRIHEVSKLRTVTALQSFTRPVRDRFNDQNRPVPVDLAHQDQYDNRWYGAAEAQGEGLLITLADGFSLATGGERWNAWEQQHSDVVQSSNVGQKQFMHHALRGKISRPDTLSRPKKSSKSIRCLCGGIRLPINSFGRFNTTQDTLHLPLPSESTPSRTVTVLGRGDSSHVTEGGMDGTLGGLTALAPNMQRYLDDVARRSELCSNDPLCSQTTSSSLPEDRGCYSCSYNSETSCKHFNLSLDRLLLRECVGLR